MTCRRHARIASTLMAATAAAAFSACKTAKNGSAFKHDLGEPVGNTAAWNWRQLKPGERQLVERGEILPRIHPLTVRAQFWADRIDAAMRQT